MAGYPKIFNIEMDPHEDLNVFGLFPFAAEPALKVVEEYLSSVKKYPNPCAQHHAVSQRWPLGRSSRTRCPLSDGKLWSVKWMKYPNIRPGEDFNGYPKPRAGVGRTARLRSPC